jgi:hypothetical protein
VMTLYPPQGPCAPLQWAQYPYVPCLMWDYNNGTWVQYPYMQQVPIPQALMVQTAVQQQVQMPQAPMVQPSAQQQVPVP